MLRRMCVPTFRLSACFDGGSNELFKKAAHSAVYWNKRTRGERVQNNKINPEPGPSVPFWEEKETSNKGVNEGGGGGQAERSLEAAGGQL